MIESQNRNRSFGGKDLELSTKLEEYEGIDRRLDHLTRSGREDGVRKAVDGGREGKEVD